MNVKQFQTLRARVPFAGFACLVVFTTALAACQGAVDEKVQDDDTGKGGGSGGGINAGGTNNATGGTSQAGTGGASLDAAAITGGRGGANTSPSDAGTPPDGPAPKGTPTFAAAGYSGIRIVSRDLGKTWVDSISSGGGGDDPNLLRGIGCGNGLCVAGGGSAGATGRLLTTADGKTWKEFMTGAAGLSDVAFGNNIWVSVSGHYAARSEDGYKWDVNTDKGALSFGGILRQMTFAGGKFIAWGDGGKRVHSVDGRAWTRITSGSEWRSVAFGSGIFVAVGSTRQTSTDASTWTSDGGTGGAWIVFTGTNFVYGGSDGNVYKSTDGKTWQSEKGFMLPQQNVAYGAGVFVAYGATSSDGVKWLKGAAPSAAITDVDFGYLAQP